LIEIANSIFALFFIIISIFFLFSVGAILYSNRHSNDYFSRINCLVELPILGLGIVLFVFGNLFFNEFNIITSSVFCFSISLAGLIRFIPYLKISVKKNTFDISTCTFILIATIGIILLVQAAGPITQGLRLFGGNSTRDMWNYTSIAQYAMDHQFFKPYLDGNMDPLLPIFEALRNHRIGSSIAMAAFGTMLGLDAKEVWGIVSVLGPILLVFALWSASKPIKSYKYKILAILWGASLPCIAWVHIENTYLANALVTPFIVFWPYFFAKLMRQPSLINLFKCSLILMSINFIYGEISLLIVVISFIITIFSILNLFSFRQLFLKLFLFFSVAIISLALIPNYYKNFLQLIFVPLGVYADYPPDGRTLNGLIKLFLINPSFISGYTYHLSAFLTIFIIFIGFSTIVRIFFHFKDEFSLGILLFALVPIALFSYPIPHTYQYYKSLTIFLPLVPIGFFYFIEDIQFSQDYFSRLLKLGLVTTSIIFTITAMCFTIYLGLNTKNLGLPHYDSLISSKFDYLNKQKNKNFLIVSDDGPTSAWLAIYGRNNNLWMPYDFYGSGWPVTHGKYNKYLDLSTLPKNNFDIVQVNSKFEMPTSLANKVGIIFNVDNTPSGGVEKILIGINKPLKITLQSKINSTLIVSFSASLPEQGSPTSLIIHLDDTFNLDFILTKNKNLISFPIKIKQGFNNLRISSSNSDIELNKFTFN